MTFRLVQKLVTLNGVMALIFRYFTEFVYNLSLYKQLLHLPQFQNLLLIVYDNTNTICAIIICTIIGAKQTLITRFDGRRCTDD